MDASQYKDYVLVLLFVKYVSDKYAGQPDALIDVPQGGSFTDMVALKGDKEIGDKINKIIARLAEANDLKGVIDVADFNDPDKLGQRQGDGGSPLQSRGHLREPRAGFQEEPGRRRRHLGRCLRISDAPLRHRIGQEQRAVLHPAEVSRIMAKVIGINKAKTRARRSTTPPAVPVRCCSRRTMNRRTVLTIYGQEMDNATAALAKMNMILHDNPTAEIWQDNTLSSPHCSTPDGSLKTFDFVVANPPFSNKAWSNGFDPANDLYSASSTAFRRPRMATMPFCCTSSRP